MATLINNSTQKALTTLARAKVFLGIGSDTYDTALTQIINQVTGFIERYTRRSLLSQTYTNEIYDGPGYEAIILKQFPVTAVSSVQERDTDDPSVSNFTTINASDYYWSEDGIIRSRVGDFLKTPQRYRITYTAGYKIDFDNENSASLHTLPMEIEYACHKLVSALFNTRRAEGFESTSEGDVSVTLKKKIFGDEEVKSILDKYAKPII